MRTPRNYCFNNFHIYSCCSVVSDSLRLHGLQHARLPCPLPSPRACSNSCPLSQWCHPTISSSVIPFSCPQSFLASESFPVSQLFTSDGQSIGASASVLSMNIQDYFPLGLTWSPCSPRDSQESSPTPQFKSVNSLVLSLLYGPTLTSIHDHWRNHSFDCTWVAWITFIILYLTPLVLYSYLVSGSLYLLTSFLHPPPSTSCLW